MNHPTNYDPTRSLTTYSRDGNAADLARRESRRECAVLPAPEPTAAQLAHGWGVPLPIVERLFAQEARMLALEARLELLESK